MGRETQVSDAWKSSGAFVPGTAVRIPGREGGPLSDLAFAVKDLFDVAGEPTGGGNPDWGRTNPVPERHAALVDRFLLGRGDACRQDHHRRDLARDPGRERVPRHSPQPFRARLRSRRVVLGLGGGGRGGSRRLRARERYRRLGTGARELLRPLRDPADPRAGRRCGPDAPGAELRYRGLVRARRRDVPAGVGGGAGRGRPAADSAAPARLLVARDAFAFADPAVAAALRGTRSRLAALAGAAADVTVAPQGLSVWARAQRALQTPEALATFRDWVERTNPRLTMRVARILVTAESVSAAERQWAELMRHEVRARLRDLLDPDSLLCLPTTPFPAPPVGLPLSRHNEAGLRNHLPRRDRGALRPPAAIRPGRPGGRPPGRGSRSSARPARSSGSPPSRGPWRTRDE